MGGARKYEPHLRAKLNLLSSVHEDYILAKKEMRIRIEEEYRAKLQDFEFRESRLMNELVQLGVAKTDIGRAVKLANWNELERKYALTRDEVIKQPATPALTVTVPLEPRPETTKLSVHLFASFTVNWHEFGSDYVEGPYKVDVYRWLDSLTGKPDHWLVVDEYPENKATPIGEYLWNLQYEIRAGDRSKRAVVADWEAYLKNEFEELVKADAKRKAGL